MKQHNYQKGKKGEKVALDFLISKGWILVEMNYSNDIGEIDLIMIDQKNAGFCRSQDEKFGCIREPGGNDWGVKVSPSQKSRGNLSLITSKDQRKI